MTSHLRIGDRVTTRPSFSVGTIRYIEDGAACVKWDDLPMIYTYDLKRLTLAPVRQPREIIPAWAIKLQAGAR